MLDTVVASTITATWSPTTTIAPTRLSQGRRRDSRQTKNITALHVLHRAIFNLASLKLSLLWWASPEFRFDIVVVVVIVVVLDLATKFAWNIEHYLGSSNLKLIERSDNAQRIGGALNFWYRPILVANRSLLSKLALGAMGFPLLNSGESGGCRAGKQTNRHTGWWGILKPDKNVSRQSFGSCKQQRQQRAVEVVGVNP